jgi:hypothetical protein
MNSGDTDGLRAGQRGHAIERSRADVHLGGHGANRARRQTPARESLQTVHQRLGERTPVIAGLVQSDRLLRVMASIALLRQAAPDVRCGQGTALSRDGVVGVAGCCERRRRRRYRSACGPWSGRAARSALRHRPRLGTVLTSRT